MSEMSEISEKSDISSFFQMIDKDKDGFITFSELKSALSIPVNHNGIVYECGKDINLCFRMQSYLKKFDDNRGLSQKISLEDLIQ